MRHVTDPKFDAKAFVAAGYDRCAKDYASARASEVPPYLHLLTRRIVEGAKVLDVGCGCGIPIAALLSHRYRVTGVDISEEQLKLASKAVPNATFIHGDATKLTFEEGAFDAAVMLYALFQIPRSEHAAFFKSLRSWLVKGGLLLASLADNSEPVTQRTNFSAPPCIGATFPRMKPSKS